jgi:hypothetical protein
LEAVGDNLGLGFCFGYSLAVFARIGYLIVCFSYSKFHTNVVGTILRDDGGDQDHIEFVPPLLGFFFFFFCNE